MPNTNRRLRRPSAAILAVQDDRDDPVEDFTLGADSIRVWSIDAEVDTDQDKSVPGPWMTQLFTEDSSARYSVMDSCTGTIAALATPESVKMFLRSNWGPFAGIAFSLASQVNEWLTLAWIEDRSAGSTQNLVRLQDVFLHRVRLVADRTEGRLLVVADYAARKPLITPLNALGPIVLPANPAAPADTRVFSVRDLLWRRDPAGADVSLAYTRLEIEFDQRVIAEWTYSDDFDVYKGGKTFAKVSFDGVWSDETWALLTDARAGTKRKFRLVAVSDGVPATLIIDLNETDFEFAPLGHDESEYRGMRAVGRSHRSGSDFATITLS